MSVSVDFEDVRGSKGPTGALAATLEATPAAGGAGLDATVSIVNEGAGAVVLRNPYDMLQWQLAGADGRAIDLPVRAPSALINRPTSEFVLDTGVPISAVRVDGRPASEDTLERPGIELAPGTRIDVTFRFDQPPGRYSLGAILTLIADGDSRIVRAPAAAVELA